MRTSAELREGFLSYFESKGHKRHPSGSLVPPDWDRSTLLNSAGMQPLMPYFLGREAPPAPLLTTVQKCFRTPDIDEVGLDTLPPDLLRDARQLLVRRVLQGRRDRLRVGVRLRPHEDRPRQVLGHGLRRRSRAPARRGRGGRAPLGGDGHAPGADRPPRSLPQLLVGRRPGPCGPDTELFYDRGEGIGCGRPECAPGCSASASSSSGTSCSWSTSSHEDGTVTPLPKQNVDTGMGFERTAAILQDVISVYDTDGYQAIMDWIARESGVAYGDSEVANKAHCILADHGRGMTFLSGTGSRRRTRAAGTSCAASSAERFSRLVESVSTTSGGSRISSSTRWAPWYPELVENRERDPRDDQGRGGALLADARARAEGVRGGRRDAARSPARTRSRLHDTYGFPFELTRELAPSAGCRSTRRSSRASWPSNGIDRARSGATIHGLRFDAGLARDRVRGLREDRGAHAIGAYEPLDGRLFQAKLSESPFYPEGGGQVTDRGYIEHEETGARARAAMRRAGSATTRCSPSRARASPRATASAPSSPW